MVIVPEAVRELITIDDAFICIYILAIIIGLESGLLLGLVSRAGSIGRLFRLSRFSVNTHTQTNDSSKSSYDTTNKINK